MTDIVERFREWATHYHRSGVGDHFKEAADEIERLRGANQQLPTDTVWVEIGRLRQQNAELLVALKQIVSESDDEFSDVDGGDIARAAIEKAKA